MTTQAAYAQTKSDAAARIKSYQAKKGLLEAELARMIEGLPESELNELLIEAVELRIDQFNSKIRTEIETIEHCELNIAAHIDAQ